MLNFYNNDPSFLISTVKRDNEWPCTSTAPVWKLRRNQVIDMHGIFCLVFTASAKGRVELRAKIGQYRNRCFNTWCIYNVTWSWKSLEKYTIMRKLLSYPMISSSPEWWVNIHPYVYDPTETRQVWTREFSIRNAHMIRTVFVSAWGVRRHGMGSTKD